MQMDTNFRTGGRRISTGRKKIPTSPARDAPSGGGLLDGATENAGVELAGVDRTGGKCRSGKSRSKSYGTPNRDYFERILSYLNLVR